MNEVASARIDTERNRRMLLDAAAAALAGAPDASLGTVAQLAGLTRATLYRHFSSRDELLTALRDDALTCARAAISGARVNEGTAIEALRRVVAGIVSFGSRFRPILMDVAGKDPEFLRQREEAFFPIAQIIQRGQQSGEMRSDVSAQWVVTALMALLVAAVRADDNSDDSQTVEMVLRTLVFGIQGQGSSRN